MAAIASSGFSNSRVPILAPVERAKSAMFSSSVAPVTVQIVAPCSSAALLTPTLLRTRKPWPA